MSGTNPYNCLAIICESMSDVSEVKMRRTFGLKSYGQRYKFQRASGVVPLSSVLYRIEYRLTTQHFLTLFPFLLNSKVNDFSFSFPTDTTRWGCKIDDWLVCEINLNHDSVCIS
jgi:hypothetical protein